MIYQIVSPVIQTINGDSLKDAIKNFVKVNDAYRVNKIIVTDQQNAYYNATINYYKNKYNKNKAKIDIIRNIDNVGWNVYPKNEPNILVSTPIIGSVLTNNTGIQPIVTARGAIPANSKGPILFPSLVAYPPTQLYPV
jgi:hypothetical protein